MLNSVLRFVKLLFNFNLYLFYPVETCHSLLLSESATQQEWAKKETCSFFYTYPVKAWASNPLTCHLSLMAQSEFYWFVASLLTQGIWYIENVQCIQVTNMLSLYLSVTGFKAEAKCEVKDFIVKYNTVDNLIKFPNPFSKNAKNIYWLITQCVWF